MKAARCAFIAGVSTTSNVLAGLHYGIPLTGTMAHSYVSAFPREIDAFRAFARAFPAQTILLLDTYDTVAAARKAVVVAKEMETRGQRLAGVRLDSGDLVGLSRQVRRLLDEAGLAYVKIVVSGGLDETSIGECLARGAPIDASSCCTTGRSTRSTCAIFPSCSVGCTRAARTQRCGAISPRTSTRRRPAA